MITADRNGSIRSSGERAERGRKRLSEVNGMRSRDQFRGCLIGGAAGDALGYAVEFMQEGQIFRSFGPGGITEYELLRGEAQFSDDTQMTLFTAAGLLAGTAKGKTGTGLEGFSGCVNDAYLDWFNTQRKHAPSAEGTGNSWLADVAGLYSPRAPGNTCMSALYAGGRGTPEDPMNQSKGCGGVMRVAPVGLYFNDRGRDLRDIGVLGAEAAALTHGHPLGWMSAAALALIVHFVSQDGESIPEATENALDAVNGIWPARAEAKALRTLVLKALDLAADSVNDLEAIHLLGEGWVGEEALAIAVYCAAKYPDDIDRALIAAVNHKGDSDSTGAVAGNIVGARVGLSGIPAKYTEKLELLDVITRVADDLWEDRPDRERYGRN